MLARLGRLLTGSRCRRLDVGAEPADVLMQSALVLRGLQATVARLDLEAGTLEARLRMGGILRLRADAAGEVSRVAIDVDGTDWAGVSQTLARELSRGAAA
jgi:hypothetical protein